MKKVDLIANEYLRSFVEKEENRGNALHKIKGTKIEWSFPSFSKREETKVLFEELRSSALFQKKLATRTILADHALRDLNLIVGHGSHVEKHLLKEIDRTMTTAGRCVLASELAHPHATYAPIAEKQQIVKILQEKEGIRSELRKRMEEIAGQENERAVLWSDNGLLNNPQYGSMLEEYFYKFYIVFGSISIDKHSLWKLTFAKWMKDFIFGVYYLVLVPFGLWAQMSFAFYRGGIYTKIFILGVPLGVGGWTLWLTYYSRYQPIISFLARSIRSWQSLIEEAEKISDLIASDPALEKVYGKHLVKTRRLLSLDRYQTQEGKMLYALRHLSLRNWYFFFSHTGRLLLLKTLFEEHKRCLGDMVYEMGFLDVRLSTVALLEEGDQEGGNGYVFSTLLDEDLPTVKGEGIWHPMLSSKKAIPNDIVMGGEVDPRTIVITGPNAGGKSTYILTLATGVVMSQSLGVVSARKFVHSLISDLITYINPTQDLAEGLSLAEAGFEMLRMHKKCIDKGEGVALAIVDEILNGIEPGLAQKYSEMIISARHTQKKHLLSVVTTHYMNLPKLAEKLDRFANKKVEVMLSGIFIDYTYKILDGVSDQNIVERMLKNKGVI